MMAAFSPAITVGGVAIAVRDGGEDRGVGDPKPLHTVHPELRIHHTIGLATDPGGAGGVGVLDLAPDDLVEGLAGRRVAARVNLAAHEAAKR